VRPHPRHSHRQPVDRQLALAQAQRTSWSGAGPGETLIARSCVVRPDRTLIVTQAEVFAVKDGKKTQCALMQQTIMVVHGKSEK
jgi:acyl-coenzyme A thioesterase PaaI-like protein